MNLPNSKELKKLADACRKAGIKQLKTAEFEFTLSDDAPVKPTRTRQSTKATDSITSDIVKEQFETDSLTSDQLLFWSGANLEDEQGTAQ